MVNNRARREDADYQRLMQMVQRAALDMQREESRLRELIRELIRSNRADRAAELLFKWDGQAAGDVLRDYAEGPGVASG